MAGSYTDLHRSFLQGLLIRPYIDVEEGKEMLAHIKSAEDETEVSPDSIPTKAVLDVLHSISNAISHFDLEIREMPDQEDGKRYWSLVNVADDEIIRIATTHSPDEISFFKRLLDEIFETSNTPQAEIMAVKSMRALSLNKNSVSERAVREVATQDANGEQSTQKIVGAGMGLTKTEAEEALIKFIDEGWLERDRNNYHYLSTRALLELEMYLIDTYNVSEDEEDEEGNLTRGPKKLRIKHCNVCKYIHTIGQRCSKRECPVRIHNHCAATFFSSVAMVCPTCKTEWKGDPVGPKAVQGSGGSAGLRRARGRDSEGIQPQRLSKSQKKSIEKSKSRRSTMLTTGEEDEEDEEDEEQEEEAGPGPSRSRNSLGRRSRTSPAEEDEDEDEEEPPRKLSRIMNGSSRRSSVMNRARDMEESDGADEGEDTGTPQIKKESSNRRSRYQNESDEEEDDEEEAEELPRRMSKTTLKTRRR